MDPAFQVRLQVSLLLALRVPKEWCQRLFNNLASLKCSNERLFRRRRAVELLPELLKVNNHLLALLAHQPLGKGLSHLGVRCLLSNQQMSRVEKRIVGLISSSLVDDGLVSEGGVE